MAHLKKNRATQFGVKATNFVAKQGLSIGLKAVGMATGPIGWIASFLGKRIIDKLLMPHVKAIAINANRHYQARVKKKKWKNAMKEALKEDLSVQQYINLRNKVLSERRKVEKKKKRK